MMNRCRKTDMNKEPSIRQNREHVMTRRPFAFTLMEVIVVVAIIAIAAAASVGFMSATSSTMRLNGAVQSFVADLFYAQNQAITAQKKVYVVFTPGSSTTADKYELQYPLGTVLARADGATGTVTMGRSGTQMPGAKLGFTTARTIGFDAGGQPFTRSGTTDTPITAVERITLKNTTGNGTTDVDIQPFSGEIIVQ